MKGHPNRRRKYLVSRFQHELLAIYALHFVGIMFVFAATLFVPLMIELRGGELLCPEEQEAAIQFLSLHTRVWPAVLVAFLLLMLHAVFVSHRIAGPLYRFREIFKRIGEGDLSSKVRLRKRDFLTSEADVINEMISGLSSKIEPIQRTSRLLKEGLERLGETVESRPESVVKEELDELCDCIKDLERSLNQFRIISGEPAVRGDQESGESVAAEAESIVAGRSSQE